MIRASCVAGEEAGSVTGAILATDPAVGSLAERDTAVNLVVSPGPPPVPVPDVVNMTLEAAVGTLESVGLVANVFGGGAGGGTIVTQVPAVGTLLLPESPVRIEVRGG